MPQPDAAASLPAAQPAKSLIGGARAIRTAGPPQGRRRFRDCPLCICGTSGSAGEIDSFARGTGGSNLLSSASESSSGGGRKAPAVRGGSALGLDAAVRQGPTATCYNVARGGPQLSQKVGAYPRYHLSGVAHRINFLTDVIDGLRARSDTVFMNGSQITDWYLDQRGRT